MYKKQEESRLSELARQCVTDSERWFPDSNHVPHHTLSLCGEVGEVANIVKKIERGSLNIKDARVRYDLAMEITDAFIYLLNLAGLLGIDLEKAYMHKRAENEKRFNHV